MIKLDSVEVRQALVPVVRVLLHDPDLVLDAADTAERAGARINLDFAQIIVVVLESLFTDDNVPAAGDRRHDKVGGARLRQFEFYSVFVTRIDLADRLKQDTARNADALRRFGDAIKGGLYILGRQLGAVVKLHALAQEKGVGFVVFGNLPAVRQIRDDGLATVARITPDQIVEHAALGAQVVDR